MASLKEAVKILKRGGLVGFPTESFWALGADATNAEAVKLIYTVKGRELGKPIALLASDAAQVNKFFRMVKAEQTAAKKNWPGALTILLQPKRQIASRALGAKRIGIRVPPHAGARALAKALGRPITATSLNISGQPPMKSRRAVEKMFPGLALLAGSCGRATKPSTVIEVIDDTVHVLRKGAVRV